MKTLSIVISFFITSVFLTANVETFLNNNINVSTSDTSVLSQNEIVFSLDLNAAKVFSYTNELGEEVQIRVSPVRKLQDSTLKKTFLIEGSNIHLNASYNIDVQNNRIIRTYNPKYTAKTFNCSSASLIVNSTTQATYSLIGRVLITEKTFRLISKVNSNGTVTITF